MILTNPACRFYPMLSIHPHVNPSFCTGQKFNLFAGAIKTTPPLKPFLVNFEYHNTNAPNVIYILFCKAPFFCKLFRSNIFGKTGHHIYKYCVQTWWARLTENMPLELPNIIGLRRHETSRKISEGDQDLSREGRESFSAFLLRWKMLCYADY